MDRQSSTGEQQTAELPTANVGLASTPGTQREVKTSLASTARERCPVCGAATAADQHYCVECGQRLGGARPLFMQSEGSLTRPGGSPVAPPPRQPRFRMSPNSTLIAGIGTLMLAMGVGVLIGRTSNPTPKSSPVQYVTAPTSGASTTPTTAQSTTPGANASTSAAKSTTPSSAKAATTPSKTATAPPNPTVKVGQKGSGKGYQHHEFTGHFFGGENEEEAGEEPEKTTGSKSKSPSTGKGKK